MIQRPYQATLLQISRESRRLEKKNGATIKLTIIAVMIVPKMSYSRFASVTWLGFVADAKYGRRCFRH